MSVVVFTGPTMSAEECRELLDAEYRPPVAQGDVYRAARQRPFAIGIIDGYFERVPSVWHKEILWAMNEGVHVYGSASMGALRAAELAAFGMKGVGVIFDAYDRGLLTDDDEVAVAHGPAERGFGPTSEAMVNIRATLAAAATGDVISPTTHRRLVGIAKALFYPDRNFPVLLRQGHTEGLPAAELQALEGWLPQGRVDQKRLDAAAMLGELQALVASGAAPKPVSFRFAATSLWEALRSEATERGPVGPGGDGLAAGRVLEELRLDPAFERIRAQAQVAILARRLAQHLGVGFEGDALSQAGQHFWSEREVGDPCGAESWMGARGLNHHELGCLIEREAYRRWATQATGLELTEALLDEARLSGDYARLVARAREKNQILDERGLQNVDPDQRGPADEVLLGWWFRERVGVEVPKDLGAYADQLGFADDHALRRALRREYCFALDRPA